LDPEFLKDDEDLDDEVCCNLAYTHVHW
jgi:hypothetical protein